MICIAQTLWQVFQIASDVWLSHWTSTSTSVEETAFYIEIYSALCFGCILMVLLRAFLIMLSGWKASRTLFYNMAASLLGTSMPFFDKNPMGRIVNRFAEDMATIDTLVGSLLTAMVVIRWGSLLFIPIIYLYVSLSLFYLQPSRELSRLINVTNSPVLSFLDEVDHGFILIRTYGVKYLNQFMDRHAHHVDVNIRMRYTKCVVEMWFEMCIQLQGTAIVVIVATGLVVFRSMLSAGVVGLAFNYIMIADANTVDLVKRYSWLEISMIAPERVLQYCRLENEDPHSRDKTEFVLHEGAIEFNQVQFRYVASSPFVLQDLTCSIRGGEKIGIVGRTGAGKSSLTMVLFRMYPIESGSISIDGRDISTIAKQELRQQLSIIPQSPVLFKGTLRQYLDPFESFDDAAL
ncbi:hypothetical protein AeNC1_010919, partial [Aphanomyces euteiches]